MSKKLIQAAAGAAGGESVYAEDVFSTYLYDGNSSTQTITNNIKFGGVPSDGVYVHLDGESLTNKAPSSISVTNNNVSTYTGEFKFGTKSLNFDASNPSYLYLSEAAIDSSDSFCVETWVYFSGTTGTSTAMQMIAAQYINSQPGRLLFGGQSGNVVVRVNGGTVYLSGAVSADTWHHVAWTYDGTTHRLFVDGSLEDTSTTMPSIYTGINTQIGGTDDSYLTSYDLTGFLDEFRLTKGKARYTSSFSVPTAAFPTDTEDDSGEGGAVWLKSRNVSSSHVLVDTERGASNAHFPDLTNEQQTIYPYISSFNNNGFTLGNMSATNASSNNYTSWSFRKQAGFFDVVTYTGNGTAGRTVSHNLGSVPGCIIVKRTDSANGWPMYHRQMNGGTSPETYFLRLNSSNGQVGVVPSRWNDTAPTSTEFTLSNNDEVNGSGGTYVAYLFAHDDQSFGDNSDESIIKCGSFDGATGTEIDLGWEPQWVIWKNTDATASWGIADSMRGIPNGSNDPFLAPQSSAAEVTGENVLELTSTGFIWNPAAPGDTYIYIAIRRPMKIPEAGTDVFEVFEDRTDISAQVNGTMGPVDLTMQTQVPTPISGYHFTVIDRMRGATFLNTSSTSTEGAASVYFDVQQGVRNEGWFSNGGLGYNFKRARGFFDVVTYTGDGTADRPVAHNLGVVPTLRITKNRTSGGSTSWWVYYIDSGGTQTRATLTQSPFYSNTDVVSTAEYIYPDVTVTNNSGTDYITYLFATVDGVSKISTYTGNGGSADINVDCGFASGARFVLIKSKTESTNWLVWDSLRGIVAGNDPYLQLNSTATEVTSNDYIDPYSAGFTVTTNAPTSGTYSLNASGVEYVFLAIA